MKNAEPESEDQCLGDCSNLPSDLNLYGRVLKLFKWIGIDFKQCTNLAGVDDVRERIAQAWKCWANKSDENMNMFIEVLSDGLPKMIKDHIPLNTYKSIDCYFTKLKHVVRKLQTYIDLENELQSAQKQPQESVRDFGIRIRQILLQIWRHIQDDEILSTDRKSLADENAMYLFRKTFIDSFAKPIREIAYLDIYKKEDFYELITRLEHYNYLFTYNIHNRNI